MHMDIYFLREPENIAINMAIYFYENLKTLPYIWLFIFYENLKTLPNIWLFNFYENLKTFSYIKAGYSSEKININYGYLYGWKTRAHANISKIYTQK